MGTDFAYDDTSHQVILDHINGGSGSGPLQDASREWQTLGNEIGSQGKSFVHSAISRILANRAGAAANAAVLTTSAMLSWMDDVTQITTTSAQRAQQQAEYWVTAKNSVPPVPPAPKSAGFFSDPGEWAAQKVDWFPGVTSDQEIAQQRQQDAAEQARQAMRVYQTSSNRNIEAAPAFTAPQTLDGSVGSPPLTAPSYYDATSAPAMTGSGAPTPLMATHQPATYQPVALTPAAHQPATPAPAATVSQLAGGGYTAPVPGGVATPEGWAGAGNTAGSQSILPGTLAAGAALSGGAAAGRRASGRVGSPGSHLAGAGGAGHAGFGPRPGTGFGPRPTTSSPPVPERLSGAESHGVGTRGATAGGYGQPPAGGATLRGEQDRERHSKYLLHDDSHSIVGDLPPTAPPVIGADY